VIVPLSDVVACPQRDDRLADARNAMSNLARIKDDKMDMHKTPNLGMVSFLERLGSLSWAITEPVSLAESVPKASSRTGIDAPRHQADEGVRSAWGS
jgi:hypothetical protein